MPSDWLVWQAVDSAFPIGAFAHSWGLEAAWQHGEVRDPGELRRFAEASIQQAGYATLPFLTAAYRTPARLDALDELSDAFLINPVANRASRVQGRTLLTTAGCIWPSPALSELAVRTDTASCHLAPVYGATFQTIGVPLPTVQRMALFGVARGVLSAAVRLGIVGSYEAQRLQVACGPWLDAIAARCAALTEDDAVQTAPVLDLLQSTHDRLYSRLFQS